MNPHDRPLLDAAARGDGAAVRAALAAGAAVDARDDQLRTALLLAVTGDHLEAARPLLAAGADPDAADARADSPWLVTGVTGSVRMMRLLLSADPDLKQLNRFGGVSLIPAAERGHTGYVRALLTETAIDVDHVNRLGWTALLEAVILGDGGPRHEEIVRLLLTAGADPALADLAGVTAHQHAVRRGFDGMARLLAAAAAPDTRPRPAREEGAGR
ncbi:MULTISPECIES: ankyrin repeat domain-containing protein [unclassified Streptomyces]|uniref:ankyrin repeat domain-containing protein n=1 Tax=unclassified Streptomyces TaxID=2593676 RepID=UPI0029B337A8|nr:ankyrin repeat domain-containing protein [Streptomyces sp. DK15]MDX2388866.1 ankyrin repeat domain-containing protein [Streptomyces sp. DK15]